MARSSSRAGKQHQVRIIGGRWRGRKLSFTPAQGLRPTGDRIRETLFNWLAAHIHGARCVDLFTGSGALGLEAISRGAAQCTFVDSSATTLTQVSKHLQILGAEDYSECHVDTAEHFLEVASEPFDIVFIDPPFHLPLVTPVCESLKRRELLRKDCMVYIETPAKDPLPSVPEGWHLHREKATGGVAYRLFNVT